MYLMAFEKQTEVNLETIMKSIKVTYCVGSKWKVQWIHSDRVHGNGRQTGEGTEFENMNYLNANNSQLWFRKRK